MAERTRGPREILAKTAFNKTETALLNPQLPNRAKLHPNSSRAPLQERPSHKTRAEPRLARCKTKRVPENKTRPDTNLRMALPHCAALHFTYRNTGRSVTSVSVSCIHEHTERWRGGCEVQHQVNQRKTKIIMVP
jgi:hypothetical protein